MMGTNATYPPNKALPDLSSQELQRIILEMAKEIADIRLYMLEIPAIRREMADFMADIKTGQQRMVDSSLNRLYTPRQISKIIGKHYCTVLDMIKDGRLIPTEGTNVSGWELERFLQESTKTITGV